MVKKVQKKPVLVNLATVSGEHALKIIAELSARVIGERVLRPVPPAVEDFAVRLEAFVLSQMVELWRPPDQQEAAQFFGVSSPTFRRACLFHDVAFMDIVYKARFKIALELFAEAYTISEVSMQVGFSAVSGFSRWFRTYVGDSPGRYVTVAKVGRRRLMP